MNNSSCSPSDDNDDDDDDNNNLDVYDMKPSHIEPYLTDSFEHDTLEQLNNMMHAIPGQEYLRAVYHPVTIDITPPLKTDKVLFDTGALHANYISKSFVDTHYSSLHRYMFRKSSVTTLADKKTRIPMDYILFLPISITTESKSSVAANLPFWVFDMDGNDMIIGLPAILKYFCEHLVDMLVEASSTVEHAHTLAHTQGQDLIYPWSHSIEVAPEEADDELPTNFPTFIANMNTTMEEAIKTYLETLPLQVTPAFIDGTPKPVMELLRTKGTKVFIPDLENWAGIQGIEPLKIHVTDDLPPNMKPKPRHINKNLFDAASKEFTRLTRYMYTPSDSPIAVNITVAPKATSPFIRICGDYRPLNPYIKIINWPVKKVQHELHRISNFRYFVNADLTNSFHQIPLDPSSRGILSIVTPFGQFEPRFLPEGISLASHVLQKWMDIIFKDCQHWIVVIWDNLLIMAHSYDELHDRLNEFLDICIKHNLRLKLTKTWFGQEEVDFFGYNCSYQKYGLSAARKDAILQIPFPDSLTQMKRFLGSAQFFSSFMQNFSIRTAPFHNMVKKDFNWNDKSSWKEPYEEIFNQFKQELIQAVDIYYPDYDLPWILRTDASQLGVGCALFMVHTADDNTDQYRPIGFMSHKFSDTAVKWSTIEQECYGCFYGIKSFSYLLRGKQFTLETDHRNLLWMEKSEVAKIIRWRIYMQGFDFLIRHIPGRLNNFPDFLSRSLAYVISSDSQSIQSLLNNIFLLALLSDISTEEDGQGIASFSAHELNNQTVEDVLNDVHNAKNGHFGVARTMKKLDTAYPGHKIPYKVVADYITRCSICQKERLGMMNSLTPIVRHLKPAHQRSTIGIDDLTITPADTLGNKHLIVIVVHFTKLAWGHPCKECTADEVASSLLIFFSLYGRYDVIMSDPGTAIMAQGVRKLNEYLGFKEHKVSLVDRHTSNGVEGTNKQILRHIRALTMEERVASNWSSPAVLPVIFFIINSNHNSETNMIPFHAHFGTADATYLQMPETLTEEEQTHEFVKLLDANLKVLTAASKKFQDELALERTNATPADQINIYQPGDFVLWDEFPDNSIRSSKLTPKFRGPYEVISQYKNDVTARHVNLGHVNVLDSARLKRFLGTTEEAIRIAMVDQRQFLVDKIISYRGHPSRRNDMWFLVQFEDGDKIWKLYDKDLSDSIPFEDFCRQHKELLPLLQTVNDSAKYLTTLRKSPITSVEPGNTVFVNLRHWSADNRVAWYDQLQLPEQYNMEYYVKGQYKDFINDKHLRINIHFPVFDELYPVDNVFVQLYGSYTELPPHSIEVTKRLARTYNLLSK